MLESLKAAHSHLLQKYRHLHGNNAWAFSSGDADGSDRTAWIWQSEELYATAEQDARAGAVVDPSIGVCLFLVPFNTAVPARLQLSRALAIRSQLMPTSYPRNTPSDSFGEWQVLLHWMVEQEDFGSWVAQVASLREKTAHFEEVAVDAIVRSEGNWDDACNVFGFPRLLLETRSILEKTEQETGVWRSADRLVRERLSDISARITGPLARECAKSLVTYLETRKPQDDHLGPSAPTDLIDLTIRDFRNLGTLKIGFRAPGDTASSTVVHGPNGSGKSSIYEAICIAIAGTSTRHLAYIRDKDRRPWGRADRYVDDYLTNISKRERPRPKVGLNGREPADLRLATEPEAQTRLFDLRGTFFSQETSTSLLTMSADDLSAEVARGFSQLAIDATEFVERNQDGAKKQQQAFNSRWGLRASVTRRDTVVEQIGTRAILNKFGGFDGAISWLNVSVPLEESLAARLNGLSADLSGWREVLTGAARSLGRDRQLAQGSWGSFCR